MRESGFIEGTNIIIERRFAEGRTDRYAELVAELVRLNVDLIVTSADTATLAAKRATTTIPIVMMNVSDPVGQGIVTSLARPEGNITGVIQDDSAEITAKRMQLLKDAVPHASLVAVLIDPDFPYAQAEWQRLEFAARSLNVNLRQLVVRRASEFEGAFAAIARERPDVLLVTTSPLNFSYRRRIIDLATKSRLPTMSPFREYPEAGGLMSYGNVRVDRFRSAAIYVGKDFEGCNTRRSPARAADEIRAGHQSHHGPIV